MKGTLTEILKENSEDFFIMHIRKDFPNIFELLSKNAYKDKSFNFPWQ